MLKLKSGTGKADPHNPCQNFLASKKNILENEKTELGAVHSSSIQANIMPQNRTRKGNAGPKSGKGSAPESELILHRSGPDDESDGILEKDEEEDELERLVMGDDAGFKTHLGMDAMDLDAGENSDEEEPENDDSEVDAGMENVDDADVRSALPVSGSLEANRA